MTSYFSQIQYVPDPITGERINVGVIAIDANGCRFQFVQDWRRAATFGHEDISFLKEFAEEAVSKGIEWFAIGQTGSMEDLARKLNRWNNKIQFSTPMPSVKDRDQLLAEIAPRILHLESIRAETVRHKGYGREKVISSAAQSLAAAMRNKFGRAPRGLVQRDLGLKGKIESHHLDIGIKNGVFYGGAFAVSFQTGSPKSQQKDTDAIAFAFEDVSKEQPDANLTILMLPPTPITPTYNRARHIFKSLEAPFLTEMQLSKWSSELVERLPEEILIERSA
jgi:hypothetical protein